MHWAAMTTPQNKYKIYIKKIQDYWKTSVYQVGIESKHWMKIYRLGIKHFVLLIQSIMPWSTWLLIKLCVILQSTAQVKKKMCEVSFKMWRFSFYVAVVIRSVLDEIPFRGVYMQVREQGYPVGEFQPSNDTHVVLSDCPEGHRVS